MINPKENIDLDADLERQIDFQHGLLVTSITPAEQRAACDEMARLIALRSPRRIQQMEIERGLK